MENDKKKQRVSQNERNISDLEMNINNELYNKGFVVFGNCRKTIENFKLFEYSLHHIVKQTLFPNSNRNINLSSEFYESNTILRVC